MHFIRHPKDFWSGAMFMFFGLAAVIIGQDYPMGTAGRMGPAYFPVILGAILSVIGLVCLLRALFVKGEAMEKFAWRDLILITVAVLLFGVLVRGAGMIVAVIVLVIISAYGSKQFNWKASVILAVGAALFCALVFVKALGIPLPLVGSWLGA